MSDRKQIPKKKLLKVILKVIVPLFLIDGIAAGIICQFHNNLFMLFLSFWLSALDIDLIALFYIYLSKGDLRSPITKKRLGAIKSVKLVAKIVYIFTAVVIFEGGLLLASYLIYLRAIALGLTRISAPITPQEAILTILMLILLPLPAYIVKRETVKAIRLGNLYES